MTPRSARPAAIAAATSRWPLASTRIPRRIRLEAVLDKRIVQSGARAGAIFAIHDPQARPSKVGETGSPADCRAPSLARFPSARSSQLSSGDGLMRGGWERGCTRRSSIAKMDACDVRSPSTRSRSAPPLENGIATALTGERRRASQSTRIVTAGSHPDIRMVESISSGSQRCTRPRAGAGALHKAGGRREHQTDGRLRDRNDFSTHAREHDAIVHRLQPVACGPGCLDQRCGLVAGLAEQRFDVVPSSRARRIAIATPG